MQGLENPNQDHTRPSTYSAVMAAVSCPALGPVPQQTRVGVTAGVSPDTLLEKQHIKTLVSFRCRPSWILATQTFQFWVY